MNRLEETFIKAALTWHREYRNTPWWKFKKRNKLKNLWIAASECAMRNSK